MPAAVAVVKTRRRIWPYIMGTAGIAALSSTWYCYHLWTAPIPDSMSDESSAMGEMIVLFLMTVAVLGCTIIGALLGWLIGWLIRFRSVKAVGARQNSGS